MASRPQATRPHDASEDQKVPHDAATDEVDHKKLAERDASLPVPAGPAGGPPAELTALAGADAGQGVSTDALDNIVPMIYVLQPLSPQVDENSPAYIERARPGGMWLRNSSVGVIPHDRGFLFQPCFFEKVWPEWVHRDIGGGFVARHQNRTATAQEAAALNAKHKTFGEVLVGEDIPNYPVEGMEFFVDPVTKQKKWFRPGTGQPGKENELKLTRNHAGLAYVDEHTFLPYVIPLTGSGHAVSRSWMFSMMSRRMANGDIWPSWSVKYALKTKQRTKNGKTWWLFDIDEAGPAVDGQKKPLWVTAAEYARGKELHDAFSSGEKQAEAEVTSTSEDMAGDQHGDQGSTEDVPY